jgi:hypothetical protein
MPFIGNQPALSYTSFAKQDFTTSATTSYTLDNPVANANELALFINFVRQEPTTAYSASGTSLTLTSATSATDDMYCVFLGKAVQTVNPPNASVGLSQLSATGTKDSTTFLRGDNTFAEVSAPGLNLIKEVNASNVSAVTFVDGTDSVVFDSTYKVYFCTFTNILLASDEELFLRILSGGTAQSGATAYWTGLYGTIGSPALPGAYNDRYENALWGSPGDVESTIPVSGYVYFYNVGQSSTYPMAMGQMFMQRSNGNHYAMNFAGYYKTAISNFDGFTLTNNGGGNISSGNFKLYGIS